MLMLFKGVMRIIVTARQTLTPGYEHILNRLVTILGVISKNPSNPHFDQYIFESISGLMRYDHWCFVHEFLPNRGYQIYRDRFSPHTANF